MVLVITQFAWKAPARLRHALWMLVLVKFLMPPFAYFPQQLAFWQHKQTVELMAGLNIPAVNQTPAVQHHNSSAMNHTPVITSVDASSTAYLDWQMMVVLFWAAGVVMMLALTAW